MKVPSKIILLFWFLSSYTPLWVILCISNWPTKNLQTSGIDGYLPLSIFFVIISIISNLVVVKYLSNCKKSSKHHTGEIIKVKAISDLSREYIVTYAISLIGFNLLEWKDAISFTVLLVFFAFLYIRHDQIIYNPMLELFKYKTYEVTMFLTDLPKINDEYLTREGILISNKTSHSLRNSEIPFTAIGHDGLFVEVQI